MLDQLDVRRPFIRVGQIVIVVGWRQKSTLYHFCFHLSAFSFMLPKMIFGTCVTSATDYFRYVCVIDTIEQLLMVHIFDCSCQIERDMFCSVCRIFSYEVCCNVGGDRRQCSACCALRPKPILSSVEREVCQYFGKQEFFLRFGRWAQ